MARAGHPRRPAAGRLAAVLGLVLALVSGVPATAQDLGRPEDGAAPGLTLLIDSEEAFAKSDLGQRIAEEIETASKALASENRQIEAELIEEEKRLTERRATLPPEQFRSLADAFDEKVRRIRSEQDAKARALGQKGEAGRREFLTAARPVLESIMRETGAAVILDARDVFLGAESADITAEVIERLNDTIAEGAAPGPRPQDAPAESAPSDGAGAAPSVGVPDTAPIQDGGTRTTGSPDN